MSRYRPFHGKFSLDLPDRRWPDAVIERSPIWASVDLRDGNQALPVPMNVEEKLAYFRLLVEVGFKEIEVGFPSASETEFAFMRRLIRDGAVPDDVSVQVLVQCREHLIRRTFESLAGFDRAIVHFYNSTSRLQRRVTFGNASKDAIRDIAVEGARLVRDLARQRGGDGISYQYSPESFSDTETDFAFEVCESVLEVLEPTPDHPVILNLPVTVEWTTPNYHADQIEWFCRQLVARGLRDSVIVSLHTHNDRGTGIACTELGLLAGADRVEGTLFGNGERTGNLDIVTVALNLNSHGIPTGLDFSELPRIRQIYEQVTRMRVPERQPYAGDLVFTAFSGSHQDAIKKGMDLVKHGDGDEWAVPYLTIDPEDIGRSYEAIIRINSQSGKGGVAYVLQRDFGFELPKLMQPEVGSAVGAIADARSRELSPEEIRDAFRSEFVNQSEPLELLEETRQPGHAGAAQQFRFIFTLDGNRYEQEGRGNGPINAFAQALESAGLKAFRVTNYASHAIGQGSAAEAAAYVEIASSDGAAACWGCGLDTSIEAAGLRALVSAFNRLRRIV